MASTKDFDALAMALDIVRREECERMHAALRDEREAAAKGVCGVDPGYLRGLDEAMLILDARIGELRDRWG